MTKDLALLVGPDQKWLSTTGFLDKVDANLQAAMAVDGAFAGRRSLAAANNVDWYDAVFRSLGLSGAIEHGVWSSRDEAPPYHSNAVILSPGVGDLQREIIRRLAADLKRPFSFKDGFARTGFHGGRLPAAVRRGLDLARCRNASPAARQRRRVAPRNDAGGARCLGGRSPGERLAGRQAGIPAATARRRFDGVLRRA